MSFKFTPLQIKWLEALESGNYEQGKYQLCKIDANGKEKYCCLGVLCEVYAKNNKLSISKGDFGKRYDFAEVSLSSKLKAATGFTTQACSKLMNMNDAKSFTFIEIAAEIRSKPEDYFVIES